MNVSRTQRQHDELSDLQALLHELQHLPGCAVTKERVAQLLRTLAGRRVYFARALLLRPRDVAAAVQQLDGARSVHQVRDSLCAQLGISRAKAYRIIGQALNLSARRVAAAHKVSQLTLFDADAGAERD